MKWYDRLFFALQKAGLQQKDLAHVIKAAPASLTQWKNGEAKSLEAEKFYKACKFLGIRQEWLLFGEEPMLRASNKSIQNILALLDSLTEAELEKATNILQAAFGKPPAHLPSSSSNSLSPEDIEAKYFSFNKKEKENETTFKTGTYSGKKKERS